MEATAAEGEAAPVSPAPDTPPRPSSEHSRGPEQAGEQHGDGSGSSPVAAGLASPAGGTAAAAVSATAAAQLPPPAASAESGTTPDRLELGTSASMSPERGTSMDGVRCLLPRAALGRAGGMPPTGPFRLLPACEMLALRSRRRRRAWPAATPAA